MYLRGAHIKGSPFAVNVTPLIRSNSPGIQGAVRSNLSDSPAIQGAVRSNFSNSPAIQGALRSNLSNSPVIQGAVRSNRSNSRWISWCRNNTGTIVTDLRIYKASD